MKNEDDEEKLLRSVALQNANSILHARQRAEEELVRAKEALELKTKELAHALSMMRATLESTTDGILVTDDSGKVTGFNQKYLAMWRIPPEVMDAREHRQLLEVCGQQLKDARQFLATIEEIYASSPPESFDLLQLADGRVFEQFSKIQLVDERNVGRVWSFRDITERRRGEAAHLHLSAVVASSDDAIVSKTLDGVIRSWNDGAKRIFGYAAEEVIGKPITILLPAERLHEEEQIIRQLMRGQRVDHFETVRVHKDGHLIDVSVTISPIRDSTGHVIGASKIARDISDRRRVQDALREADRRKDEFLAMLAHELRNPLAPLRNALHIIRLSDPDPKPRVGEARDLMERQVESLVRLVDDLLDVSRITRGKIQLLKERVDVATVVARAIESSRPLIDSRRHTLEVALPAEALWVDADPLRLAQVLWNLLNNAAKYTPEGGRIWLTVERNPHALREGIRHLERDDYSLPETVLVRVRDTGMGIPPEMLPKVFELFTQMDRTLDRSEGGLGIGLTLVRRLTEMHGGTVQALSAGPGLGSEFVVRLPLLAATPLIADRPLTPTRAADRGLPMSGRRILVVDDNRDAAESLAVLLRLFGNEVRTVHDGRLALEMAATYRPNVVLLDIGLPGMDGLEVCRRLREQRLGYNAPLVVALTGYGQEDDRRRSQEAGFNAHLVKPVDFGTLQELLASPELVAHQAQQVPRESVS